MIALQDLYNIGKSAVIDAIVMDTMAILEIEGATFPTEECTKASQHAIKKALLSFEEYKEGKS